MRISGKYQKVIQSLLIIVAVLVFMVSNYKEIFLGRDGITQNLTSNSQSLVYDVITMRYQNYDGIKYGLGDLYPYNGTFEGGITNQEINLYNGYFTTEKKLVVNNNEITQREYKNGNTLLFLSGDKATVVEAYEEDDLLYVIYDADEIFSYEKQGPLRNVCVYNNEEERYMRVGDVVAYESQYGLQGKALCSLPMTITSHQVLVIGRVICAFGLAVAITLIAFLLAKKYCVAFGAVFYTVSLLSPWMIGFSTNLYWVEFTWFVPMLIGLLCDSYLEKKWVRRICYIGEGIAIAIKSACGYEYISTIMLSGIVFLLADLTWEILIHKDTIKIKRFLSTTFFMGISSLLGFAVSLCMHANLRGNGSIYYGLRAIYFEDVCRRTFGSADLFQNVYAESLNATVWETLQKYFRFQTELIYGINGKIFIPLIIICILILLIRSWKEEEARRYMVLFVWLFLSGISWFVLGKAHSYIHTTLNFAMWYFGVVQFLLFIPVKLLCDIFKNYLKKNNSWRT